MVGYVNAGNLESFAGQKNRKPAGAAAQIQTRDADAAWSFSGIQGKYSRSGIFVYGFVHIFRPWCQNSMFSRYSEDERKLTRLFRCLFDGGFIYCHAAVLQLGEFEVKLAANTSLAWLCADIAGMQYRQTTSEFEIVACNLVRQSLSALEC